MSVVICARETSIIRGHSREATSWQLGKKVQRHRTVAEQTTSLVAAMDPSMMSRDPTDWLVIPSIDPGMDFNLVFISNVIKSWRSSLMSLE
jgi:hypothetical protein